MRDYEMPADMPSIKDFPVPEIKDGQVPTLRQLVQIWKHLQARKFFALTLREQKQQWEQGGESGIYNYEYLSSKYFDEMSECDEQTLRIDDVPKRSVVIQEWGDASGIDLIKHRISSSGRPYSSPVMICDTKELERLKKESAAGKQKNTQTIVYKVWWGRYRWAIRKDGKTVARSSRSYKSREDAWRARDDLALG